MTIFDTVVQDAELARTEGQHLQGFLTTAQERLGVAESALATARDRIVELETELYDLQHVERGIIGWNRDEPRFRARRLYYRAQNVDKMLTETQAVVDSGRKALVSLRAGASLDTLPALPECDFSWSPEPETKFADPSEFRVGFDLASTFLPPGARPVVCLMGWTFSPASGRDPNDWLPSSARAIAVDVYNWFGVNTGAKWVDPADMLAPCLEFAEGVGLPLLIWETNCAEDPGEPMHKAAWIGELFDVAEVEKLEQVVFFDSLPTQPGAGKFVLFSSDAATFAVEEGLSRRYFGGAG